MFHYLNWLPRLIVWTCPECSWCIPSFACHCQLVLLHNFSYCQWAWAASSSLTSASNFLLALFAIPNPTNFALDLFCLVHFLNSLMMKGLKLSNVWPFFTFASSSWTLAWNLPHALKEIKTKANCKVDHFRISAFTGCISAIFWKFHSRILSELPRCHCCGHQWCNIHVVQISTISRDVYEHFSRCFMCET